MRHLLVSPDLRAGAAEMLPANIGLIPFGLVCGVGSVAAGADWLGAWGMAAIMFSGAAQISVQLSDSGEFRITAGGPDHGEAMGESHFASRSVFNDGCTGANPPKERNDTRPWRGGELIAHIKGTADPDAAELKGSQTKVVRNKDGTRIDTHIYEWNLRR